MTPITVHNYSDFFAIEENVVGKGLIILIWSDKDYDDGDGDYDDYTGEYDDGDDESTDQSTLVP